jgi:hypothetical protein
MKSLYWLSFVGLLIIIATPLCYCMDQAQDQNKPLSQVYNTPHNKAWRSKQEKEFNHLNKQIVTKLTTQTGANTTERGNDVNELLQKSCTIAKEVAENYEQLALRSPENHISHKQKALEWQAKYWDIRKKQEELKLQDPTTITPEDIQKTTHAIYQCTHTLHETYAQLDSQDTKNQHTGYKQQHLQALTQSLVLRTMLAPSAATQHVAPTATPVTNTTASQEAIILSSNILQQPPFTVSTPKNNADTQVQGQSLLEQCIIS